MKSKMKDNHKDYIKRYFVLSLMLLVSAVNYNLFILPSNIVTGGTSGIAVVTKQLFNLEPSLVIFLLSFVLLIISFFSLDKEETIAAGFITIVYPLFVEATAGINEVFLIDKDAVLLVAVAAGIISGISSGVIYKMGLNTGGISILSKVLYKKKEISVTLVNFIINIIIVLLGGFVFGFNMIMYAIIVLYVSKIISERILVGNSTNKMFYIVSAKNFLIKDYLMNELNHDVTVFNTRGKYNNKKVKSLMVIIPTYEYMLVKEKVKEIDKKAFVTITDSYESKGQDLTINSVNPKKRALLSRIFTNKML